MSEANYIGQVLFFVMIAIISCMAIMLCQTICNFMNNQISSEIVPLITISSDSTSNNIDK